MVLGSGTDVTGTGIPRTIRTVTATIDIPDGWSTSGRGITGIMSGAFIIATIGLGAKFAIRSIFLSRGAKSPERRGIRAFLKENAIVQRIVVVGCKKIIQIGNHFVILWVNVRQHI